MRIGVVSDTHGHIANTAEAVRILGQQSVEAVLHCGDVCAATLIPLFEEWPTHFVFGNCDGTPGSIRVAIREAGQTCHERFGDFELGGRRIGLIHGDDVLGLHDAVESGDYDLICYGHTHRPEQHLAGKTLVLNPGALFRANPKTLAVVDLETMTAEHLELDGSF
ncbi:MAG: YfcE family phosphodiesterase [Planctomycetaceae bacterium]|nr:YfcE family phosphodiesterase [Planctomycetaceae bacterium]